MTEYEKVKALLEEMIDSGPDYYRLLEYFADYGFFG